MSQVATMAPDTLPRVPVPVRTRIAGIGLFLLAFPGITLSAFALFNGFDHEIGSTGTVTMELRYGAVIWGVGEPLATMSVWVFVLVLAPLSWLTLAALVAALTGDHRWLIPVALGWLGFGIAVAALAGAPTTAYAAIGILVLLLSGRAVRRQRQLRAAAGRR